MILYSVTANENYFQLLYANDFQSQIIHVDNYEVFNI